MTLAIVYETEKMIMNKLGWNLHLLTPRDIQAEIIATVFTQEEAMVINGLHTDFTNWVNFAMIEFTLYKRFDQFVLSLASLMLTLKCANFLGAIAKIMDAIRNTGLADLELVRSCVNLMFDLCKKEENEGEDEPTQADETHMIPDQENIDPNIMRNNLGPVNFSGEGEEHLPSLTTPPTSPLTRRRKRSTLSSSSKKSSTPRRQSRINEFIKIKKLSTTQRVKKGPRRQWILALILTIM